MKREDKEKTNKGISEVDAKQNVFEEYFRNVFEDAAVGKSITEINGSLRTNRAYRNMLGYSETELSSLRWQDLTHPDDLERDQSIVDALLAGERSAMRWEKRYIRKDSKVIWVDISIILHRDKQGNPLYFIATLIDISDRKIVSEALEKSQQFLLETQAIAMLGTYSLDLPTGLWESSDVLDYIFGIPANYDKSVNGWVSIIHPDWQQEMNEYFINHVVGNKERFDKEYMIIRQSDKTERWVHGIGKLKFDNNNMPVMMVGTIKDITDHKKIEEENENSRILLERTLEQSTDPVVLVSMPDTIIRIVNNSCLKFLGIDDEPSPLNTSLLELKPSWQDFDLAGNPAVLLDLPLPKSLRGIETVREERMIIRKDGTTRYALISASPIFDNKGNIIAGFLSMTDVTERKEAEILLNEKKQEIEVQNEELIRTYEELLNAKVKAEESDRLKTAFLQNMSHEIRTPMNAIMGFTELIASNYNNKAKLKKFSEIIDHRCNDLLDIINDILDIAKIESGQLSVNYEECDLAQLFSELTAFFKVQQKRMDKEHIQLELMPNCEQAGLAIITDKVKLKQILINLINNAFKYTQDGKISGGCRIEGTERIVFFVSDTGMGIPKDKHSEIFERFMQLNNGTELPSSGTGLGLSIVRGLVKLLGGNIYIESEIGKGSTFTFEIPLKTIKISSSNVTENLEIVDYDFSSKSILIVEDDFYNAEYLKEILADTGITIFHATDGLESVKISLEQSIDIVLMDIRLPGIDGYEAIKQMRRDQPNLIIIAQTAYAAYDEKRRALDAGCNDYISKPTKRTILLSMVNSYLKPEINTN